VVGVAHQNRADAQNIGYIIPWGVIEHFLADVADGPSTGICCAGFSVQPLDNPHLRAYKRLPPTGAAASPATTAASAAAAAAAADQGDVGVLIRSVPPVSPAADAVRPGDVLTALDGMAVTSAATVAFPGRGAARIGFNYLVSRKQVGDPLRVSLLRDGVPTVVTYPLASVRQTHMVPATGNRSPPEYLIVGGMVFLPLTSAYLRARYGHRWHSSAPSALVSLAHTAEKAAADDQVVILSHVLAAPINRGRWAPVVFFGSEGGGSATLVSRATKVWPREGGRWVAGGRCVERASAGPARWAAMAGNCCGRESCRAARQKPNLESDAGVGPVPRLPRVSAVPAA